MAASKPCLVGQAFLDFVKGRDAEPMMRLGGIMHAARALWASEVNFGFAYIAPDYLRQDTEEFAFRYGASTVRQIGSISRCPNVVIVGEGREIGPQHYDYLLRDQSVCQLHGDALKELIHGTEFSDFLLFPGGFPLSPILQELKAAKASVFADINFITDAQELSALSRKFASLILSTSSDLFLTIFDGDPAKMNNELCKYAESVLLKENRGGSRLFDCGDRDKWGSTPAQVRPVLHSVGVGDFFDAIFVVERRLHSDETALAYAAFAAAEYASYFRDSDIQDSLAALLSISPDDIRNLGGVVMPWELRRKIHIYLAAPDFDYVDTAPLEALAEALSYHNFFPHRPVREHGQARDDSPTTEKRQLAEADLDLLATCQLLVAVLLYDDPGTLIEIGIAIEKQIPVIVFDPFKRASNLMLTELPILVSPDLDKVIAEVFIQSGKIGHEKR